MKQNYLSKDIHTCGLITAELIELLLYHRTIKSMFLKKTNSILMKKVCIIFPLLFSLNLYSQTRAAVSNFSHSLKPDIEKVVGDYYDHFSEVKGEIISETISDIEYKSKILPSGASESTITEIKSLHNYSWQAIMINIEDYEKAVEKYKQIYNELNGATYSMHEHRTWRFKGSYDAPNDGRAFASSLLEPNTENKVFKRLKIEVALTYSMPEWTVKILIYEKEPDQDMRPTEHSEQ
jgi:hypothetical protein